MTATLWTRLWRRFGGQPATDSSAADAPLAVVVQFPISLEQQIEALRPYLGRRIPSEGEYGIAATTPAFAAMRAVIELRRGPARAAKKER